MKLRYWIVAALWVSSPAAARAQDAYSLQLFRPAIDSKGYITVDASQVLGHFELSLGLIGSLAHSVLPLSGANNTFDVSYLLTQQLQGAVGLFGHLELGASLPLHVLFGQRGPAYLSPDSANASRDLTFSAQGIGDLGVHVKARVLKASRHPLGLAASASVYFPTGEARQFLGEGQFTLRPELVVDKELGRARRFRLAINAGALIRPHMNRYTDMGQTVQNDPGVSGGGPFCEPAPQPGQAPGTCGTMQTRALATQITYGVAASFAVVPHRFDVVGELYGYVDPTSRGGAPIEALGAVKVYLAHSSFFLAGAGAGLMPRGAQAMTGQPDWRAFVGMLFEPSLGDRDGDGIPDNIDQCPDEPEDFDDFEDEDGCPDPDNDQDGILDRDDQCPNDPGPIENQGCPYPDTDKDGILDKDDWCPQEFGLKDNHGCPEKTKVVFHGGRMVTLQPIFFETDRAVIKRESHPTVNAVAETLDQNRQILLVEIQGHADERGDDDYNMRLTEARAAAVKEYLVGRGVARERLTSHGYGETRPVCAESNEACWSKNRRVEFVIVRQSDGDSSPRRK